MGPAEPSIPTARPSHESSTSGLREGFTLVFNYKAEFDDLWENKNLKRIYSYDTVFGDGKTPVRVPAA
jgi:hypothetical protein